MSEDMRRYLVETGQEAEYELWLDYQAETVTQAAPTMAEAVAEALLFWNDVAAQIGILHTCRCGKTLAN